MEKFARKLCLSALGLRAGGGECDGLVEVREIKKAREKKRKRRRRELSSEPRPRDELKKPKQL